MFMGLSAHRDSLSVSSYTDACRALEKASKTPTGRERKVRQHGFPLGERSKVAHVREEVDGSIAFRLYDTDVVTWYPDGSFEINNFGTVSTTAFASQFTPGGVHLHHPTYAFRHSGGHSGIRFRSARGWELCYGVGVRFMPEGNHLIVDEETCSDLKFFRVDTKRARAVTRQLPLKDFEAWLSVAPAHFAAAGNPLEHLRWDLEECVAALMRRNFRAAAVLLPTIRTDAFGSVWDRHTKNRYAINTYRDEALSPGSLAKLKLAMWLDRGAIEEFTTRTICVAEFDRLRARIRTAAQLGMVSESRYGIPR